MKSSYEPQPPAPEIPATLPAWHTPEPDPVFDARYLQNLLLGILIGGGAAILFEADRP